MFTKHEPRFTLSILLVLAFFIPALFITPSLAAAGDGSSSSPYSVSQAITNQDSTIKTVSGYVVGQPTSANTVITSSFPNDYAIALADSSSETNIANMVYVQIPSSFRSEFGLKTNPALKGKKSHRHRYTECLFHPSRLKRCICHVFRE
ncbi:DUF6359 domain-containing protein [Peribacillus frigoritolerans]|nr:DUF6359 domain-containing protein [Peribacillus frigoritolerans]